MLRRLALLLLPLAFVAAGCSSDNNAKQSSSAPQPTATAVTTDTSGGAPTAEPATVISNTNSSGSDTRGKLFSVLNPLELLNTAAGGQPSVASEDPSLQAALLEQSDLPSGFTSLGDVTYTVPSEFGDLHLAASMFSSGDTSSNQLGVMVMSAVVAVPPAALDKMGDPSTWAQASDADLQDMRDAIGQTGVGLSDLHLLDASGLGDGGMGMHMTMDLGALLSAFGAPDDGTNPIANGISIDMYIFARGDHLLMTMVMAAAGQSSAVDGRALAERMDVKAS